MERRKIAINVSEKIAYDCGRASHGFEHIELSDDVVALLSPACKEELARVARSTEIVLKATAVPWDVSDLAQWMDAWTESTKARRLALERESRERVAAEEDAKRKEREQKIAFWRAYQWEDPVDEYVNYPTAYRQNRSAMIEAARTYDLPELRAEIERCEALVAAYEIAMLEIAENDRARRQAVADWIDAQAESVGFGRAVREGYDCRRSIVRELIAKQRVQWNRSDLKTRIEFKHGTSECRVSKVEPRRAPRIEHFDVLDRVTAVAASLREAFPVASVDVHKISRANIEEPDGEGHFDGEFTTTVIPVEIRFDGIDGCEILFLCEEDES